jgi:hypothetical protein
MSPTEHDAQSLAPDEPQAFSPDPGLLEELFLSMMDYESGSPSRIQRFVKVRALSRTIGLMELLPPKDLFILEAAAIVHDIGIKPSLEKYRISAGRYQEEPGPPLAEELLRRLDFPEEAIPRVSRLAGRHHAYEGIDGLDYQILVEADFLVNTPEEGMTKESILSVHRKIFKSPGGKRLCRAMYETRERVKE